MITIEEEDAYWVATSEETGVPLVPPKQRVCSSCPWRLEHANQVTDHFMEPDVLDRAWSGDAEFEHGAVGLRVESEGEGGVRDGLLVMCHRGLRSDDPDALYSLDSYCPCSASIAVQQRELIRWYGPSPHPSAFAEAAALRTASRMGVPPSLLTGRHLDRADLISRAHPAITDEAIGHPALPPMDPGEFALTEPLPVFDVVCVEHTAAGLTSEQRDWIESVPGFWVQGDGDDPLTIRVEASSADAASAWVAARLADLRPATGPDLMHTNNDGGTDE